MFKLKAKCASLLATAVFLAACGGGSGGDGSNNGGTHAQNPPGSAVIGSAGGTVTSADGRVSLVIPAGALGNTQTITIQAVSAANVPPELAAADVVYEMKPDGLRFTQPVQATLEVPGAPLQADGSLVAAAGALVSASGGRIEALADQWIEVDGNANRLMARGTLTHFSSLAFSTALTTSSGIQVGAPGRLQIQLKPLPKGMLIGKTETATFETAVAGFTPNEVVLADFHYKDQSARPLRHIPNPNAPAEPDGYRGLGRYVPDTLPRTTVLPRFGDYVCELAGLWRFEVPVRVSNVQLYLKFGDALVPLQDVRHKFWSDHSCVQASSPPPPPPPPPPTPPTPPAPPTPPQNDARVLPLPFAGVEAGYQLAWAMLGAYGGESVDPAITAQRFGIAKERLQNVMVLAFSGGIALYDIALGEMLAIRDILALPLFIAYPYLFEGNGCVFGISALLSARSCYEPGSNAFGLTQVATGGFSDAGLLGVVRTPNGLTHRRWTIVDGNVVVEVQAPTGEIVPRTLRKPFGTLKNWFADGEFTGNVKSAAFSADLGYALVVTGGPDVATQLWFGRTDDPQGGKLVGTMGPDHRDAREIRCDGAVCAISHLSGNVHTFSWDGRTAPTTFTPLPATRGAVGIDISALGVNFAVWSADYRNNTVTRTLVSPAGTIVATSTKPLPPGCSQPGHAVAFRLPDGTKVVVSCSGSAVPGRGAIAVLNDSFF